MSAARNLKTWGYRILFGVFLATGLADAAVAGVVDGWTALIPLTFSALQFAFAYGVARIAWKNMILI